MDDGYFSLSSFMYTPQPILSNSIWEWELNVENHRSMIYYSVSEFNEPEFEEYDPTPYGGGYDQALTYGKPLPPSDAICYPLSNSQPTQPIPPPLQVPSNGSTNLPNGGEKEVDQSRSPPSRKKSTEEDHPTDGEEAISSPPSRKKSTEEDNPTDGEEAISSHGCYGVPGNGYGNGFDTGYEYPYGSGDGYGRQEPQAPENGFCESLFGYWPCWSKKEREQSRSSQQQQNGEEQCYGDQWGATADYIFGDGNSGYERHYQQQHNSKQNELNEVRVQNASYYQASSKYPYGERRDNGEVDSGYERYYHQQHNYNQNDLNELWVQNASYYQASSMYPYGERRDNGEVDSGYERYYHQQHNYKQNDCNELWVQNASYHQASSMYPYGERRDNEEVDTGYERYYQQQHNYKQNECKELWVQNASYYQASPSHYMDGEDSYYYNQRKYYDE